MKNLTTIAKDNGIKYSQLRDKLLVLSFIKKNRNRYVPTTKAIENGIASESSRFGNELVLSISYHYDEEKIMDHYYNNTSLIDNSLLF